MTDRELLEKAAKAAGLVLNSYPDEDFFRANHSGLGEHWNPKWNPLADDGDALRLAVKLELEVRNFNGKSHSGQQNKFWCTECWFPDGDPLAATRRAIVRAAAALAGESQG